MLFKMDLLFQFSLQLAEQRLVLTPLLDAVKNLLPSPEDAKPVTAKGKGGGEEITQSR